MAIYNKNQVRREHYQFSKAKRMAQRIRKERSNSLFIPEHEVLVRYVLVNNRVKQIGKLSKDEFIDWIYSLIQHIGLNTLPGYRLEKQLQAEENHDNLFRWYMVLEAYHVSKLRKIMFVQPPQQEHAS